MGDRLIDRTPEEQQEAIMYCQKRLVIAVVDLAIVLQHLNPDKTLPEIIDWIFKEGEVARKSKDNLEFILLEKAGVIEKGEVV